jgi:serine/threonine protein phosphatase PrpC
MGAIRSIPNNEINIHAEKLNEFNYVEASVCGWQHSMEDFTGYAQISEKVSVFFVIDGHGGQDLAHIAAECIP